jgi:hypothetical protein
LTFILILRAEGVKQIAHVRRTVIRYGAAVSARLGMVLIHGGAEGDPAVGGDAIFKEACPNASSAVAS